MGASQGGRLRRKDAEALQQISPGEAGANPYAPLAKQGGKGG